VEPGALGSERQRPAGEVDVGAAAELDEVQVVHLGVVRLQRPVVADVEEARDVGEEARDVGEVQVRRDVEGTQREVAAGGAAVPPTPRRRGPRWRGGGAAGGCGAVAPWRAARGGTLAAGAGCDRAEIVRLHWRVNRFVDE
jgi:hypothetical protein